MTKICLKRTTSREVEVIFYERIIILSHRRAVQLRNHVIGYQRGFKYTEHKPFGRRYLGVTRTTMSSAVHTHTQMKAHSRRAGIHLLTA